MAPFAPAMADPVDHCAKFKVSLSAHGFAPDGSERWMHLRLEKGVGIGWRYAYKKPQ
ncbi:hypothetical protein ALP76_101224 [Pseudomonas savastanoi pv. glycinea]|uniref:Uncharacterized protein n=1 Tax=Pseudomonas savastanoi pv. glycinea TaxID=318 RepID=A0A3M3G6J8_PSESG|nr:hypothetical protein ALQ73_101207 [Pseudomonas savastanoi pv. glycinea]RMR88246.1 hypothetical protein ALP76_101224 [Pseudomonas savastanoi pv. glycinea]